jgi:hypothetical protein|tara:strand:- start:289 stop:552 length:264 start_codon:yes stop_codon:yes gene_type:complete
MTKDMMVKALSEFMADKGVMDLAEYKSHGNDVPVKDYLLRRAFGSWNRVMSVMNKRYPVSVAPVEVEKPKAAPKPKAEVKVEKDDVE